MSSEDAIDRVAHALWDAATAVVDQGPRATRDRLWGMFGDADKAPWRAAAREAIRLHLAGELD